VTQNLWITCPKPNPQASLRLFCFPYGGGGASIFRTWPDSLPHYVEVCPIQLPGRENRLGEPPFTRLSPLIQALIQAILAHLQSPFALFGHSLGALISFELARQLCEQALPAPAGLFVSGYPAPQIPNRRPLLHQLPDAEFIDALGRFQSIPQPILENNELKSIFVSLLRAEFAIRETYRYTAQPPLDCPIFVFGGLQDSQITRSDLKAWRKQTRGPFKLRQFPGDHFFIHSAQTLLLQALSQDLRSLVQSPNRPNKAADGPD